MGEGQRLVGRWAGGVVGSGPNLKRILCSSSWVVMHLLLMSLTTHSRVRTQSSLGASGSLIMSFRDISAEWKARLAGERGFWEVVSAEVEESNGSEVAYGDSEVRQNWLSVEILSYCKGD